MKQWRLFTNLFANTLNLFNYLFKLEKKKYICMLIDIKGQLIINH